MRILLVRTSALGDVVNCLPVLEALARHRPEARIAWVIEEAMAPLLDGHPLLEEVIPVRLRSWRQALTARRTRDEIARFVRRLRGFGADIALDLMGNHKGALLAALSGAPRTIGLARRFRREPSSALWIGEGVAPLGVHAAERALTPLAALGLDAALEEPLEFGGDHLFPAASPLDAAEPYVIVHPGAAWNNKRYPAAWWGRVAALLERDAGLACRVSWGPGEEELATEVVASGGRRTRPLDADGLAGLAAAIRGARLVLAGDTGPLHLAHALGAPVLGLFGPTDPQRHGPYGRPAAALWHQLPCSFCHQRLDEAKACLLSLAPERVARRARALLDSDAGDTGAARALC